MTDEQPGVRIFRRVEMNVSQASIVVSLSSIAAMVDKARELGAPETAMVRRADPYAPGGSMYERDSLVMAVEWEVTE